MDLQHFSLVSITFATMLPVTCFVGRRGQGVESDNMPIRSSHFDVIMGDPLTARFEIKLYCSLSEAEQTATGCDRDVCCTAKFVPPDDAVMRQVVDDLRKHGGSTLPELRDPEMLFLGEILEHVTNTNGGDETIRVDGFLPLVLLPCVVNSLYEAYVRTVPGVVDVLEEWGMDAPRARSIIDGCDGVPVGDDDADGHREVDVE